MAQEGIQRGLLMLSSPVREVSTNQGLFTTSQGEFVYPEFLRYSLFKRKKKKRQSVSGLDKRGKHSYDTYV